MSKLVKSYLLASSLLLSSSVAFAVPGNPGGSTSAINVVTPPAEHGHLRGYTPEAPVDVNVDLDVNVDVNKTGASPVIKPKPGPKKPPQKKPPNRKKPPQKKPPKKKRPGKGKGDL